MRSDTDHREQLDDFSEFMRRKMDDHRLPVDDLCWEEIELCMKPHRPQWIWWAGSAVGAAVIALLFLFSPFQTGDVPYDRMEPAVASAYNEANDDQEVGKEPQKEQTSLVDQPVPQKKLIAAVVLDKTKQPANEIPDTVVPEEQEEQPDAVREAEVEAESPATVSEKKEKQQDLYNYKSERSGFSAPSEPKRREDEGQWAINAGFGTGGHVSLGLGNNLDYVANTPQDNNPGGLVPPPVEPPLFSNSGTLSPDEYDHADTSLPLSFGVTVRRNFNRHIGLETGLVYTYLSSQLTKNGNVQYKSRLELHYLGIPVNLVVSLWQNPRWNIYLAGGVMVEKGLRAKQTEDRYWQMEMQHAVDKRGISGLQWSLNASAGISYRLYQDWSLYFEPRISHYFDTDQPTSIRTENSVIVGLGAGLRYEF